MVVCTWSNLCMLSHWTTASMEIGLCGVNRGDLHCTLCHSVHISEIMCTSGDMRHSSYQLAMPRHRSAAALASLTAYRSHGCTTEKKVLVVSSGIAGACGASARAAPTRSDQCALGSEVTMLRHCSKNRSRLQHVYKFTENGCTSTARRVAFPAFCK